MIKKLLFLALSMSLTFAPCARPQQTKQLSLEDLQTISQVISQLSPEEKTMFEELAFETSKQLSKKESAQILKTIEKVPCMLKAGIKTAINHPLELFLLFGDVVIFTTCIAIMVFANNNKRV